MVVPLNGDVQARRVPLDALDPTSPVLTKRVTSVQLGSAMPDIRRLLGEQGARRLHETAVTVVVMSWLKL